ncbi:uncharacterized protein LOC142635850 [Castanea sativa]|uniref:uncharacterized protein LOC142635850 n=1 Tax=Castanea sativa TaxID=21020 RepID=UPI003F64B7B4
MFNEIDGDFDDVAIRTFKVGLPTEYDLRKSLTTKPVKSVRRLMDLIEKYKQVKEDQQLGKGNAKSHDDALMVTLKIKGYDVKRLLVDQGNGAEIMYPDLYNVLNLKREDLTAYDSSLLGFDGKFVVLVGQIRLPVQAGSEVVEVDFIVVDAYSPYTAIIARPWLHVLGAVSSTLHLKVKYPSRDLIEELVGSQSVARKCWSSAASSGEGRADNIPQENIDVFAWSAYEAPRVDPCFIFHHLNVNLVVIPRKQPHWHSSKEHSEAVKEENKVVFKHVRGHENIFEILRKHKLRLNASKCSLGVGSGKFLGYMVTHRGIEINPNQVKAISSLQPPWNPKEVQKLTRMTTALNRFIS